MSPFEAAEAIVRGSHSDGPGLSSAAAPPLVGIPRDGRGTRRRPPEDGAATFTDGDRELTSRFRGHGGDVADFAETSWPAGPGLPAPSSLASERHELSITDRDEAFRCGEAGDEASRAERKAPDPMLRGRCAIVWSWVYANVDGLG